MVWVCALCENEYEEDEDVCPVCDEPRPTAGGNDGDDDDDPLKNFCVGLITSCQEAPGTKLRRLKVRVEADEDAAPIDVVTAAGNVKEGMRVAIACVGAQVKGETVTKTSVKGFPSCGMVCDSVMLGWQGGGAGAAVTIPDSCPIGSRPPATRPRTDH